MHRTILRMSHAFQHPVETVAARLRVDAPEGPQVASESPRETRGARAASLAPTGAVQPRTDAGERSGPVREPIVRLEGVVRRFGDVAALDGVDLDVERGEIHGIIGRSGAGKSTLIRTINALERVDAGRIVVDGTELARLDERGLNGLRRRVGMIFQHFNLMSAKTVADNVGLPLKLAGVPVAERTAAVDRLLALVGLADKADAFPAQLSGGQKQRVGIARALVGGPSLLLSDEATSALDPETTLSILRLLGELNAKLGVTIVLITHEMSVIREICHRVTVLDRGRVVEQGAVWDVFARPRSEITRRLLRTVRPPLPEWIERQLLPARVPQGRVVLRAHAGGDGYAAVLGALSAERRWDPRIVHAEVDWILQHEVGSVTFTLRDLGDAALLALRAALSDEGIDTEVLGHVAG